MKPLIIAHRGARGLVKYENTINAFEEAIRVGSDAIELDIHRTKDKKIVVIHDDNIKDYRINDLTYEELSNLTKDMGFVIPLFEDVLIQFKNKIYLDIEFKEEGYEEEVLILILKYLEYKDFSVRSFNDKSLKVIKRLYPKTTTGLILGVDVAKYGFFTRLGEIFPMFRIIRSKCDFVSPHYRLLILGYINRMHFLNKPVYPWTINDKNLMKKLIKKKIDGIVTDYPNILFELNNKKAEN
jgi:glycerophosphoryl diester phosphodiesterase